MSAPRRKPDIYWEIVDNPPVTDRWQRHVLLVLAKRQSEQGGSVALMPEELVRTGFSLPVLRKNAAAIIQVVWRDHSHGANGPIKSSSAKVIRYYLSLIPEAFKFVWAHVNVAENTPQSANFERTVAMNWNGRTLGISGHDMMAPAYPNYRKALQLQEAHHLLAAWAR